MFGPLPITDVMNESVETADPDGAALDAARTLHEREIGSVVVVDDGAVVGILTESDVVGLLVDGRDPAAVGLSEVVSSPVVTVDAGATVVEAAEQMRDHCVKKLPVLDDGALVGIVTTTDVSNYVPHVRNRRPEGTPDTGEVRQTVREDTAYERDDWEFEYVGHEAQIDVGDVVRFSKRLAESEVEGFADASGDTNRLHLDAAYAEGTRFGRRIVHGTLVAGTISAALARLPGLIIYLSQELSYLGPVDIDERVTAECEVVESLGGDRYRLDTRVTGADGEPVVDGEAVVLADPVPEGASATHE
jgi:acyl dehydratase/CBS domain-containing protein